MDTRDALGKISRLWLLLTSKKVHNPVIIHLKPVSFRLSELEDLITRYKFECTVLEPNIQRLIDEEEATIKPKDTPVSEFGWNHYFHLESIFAWMDKQIAENGFVEALHLGSTYEGLPIRGLKISKQSGNTGIFVDACIHAREWIAPAVATYLIDQLITSTGET
jgi:hypothetical protein